jgi:tRNA-dihydrouridine synthase A
LEWEAAAFGPREGAMPTREGVEQAMVRYMQQCALRDGTPWTVIARHMMGLRLGQAGARRWRQVWSDHGLRDLDPAEVSRRASAALADDRVAAVDDQAARVE